uniref:Uncharacterized protein n=1 Tax=Heterorhabditis bacteriophora TaxID=37862 RepID=A0A1I7XPD2_HETBA
MLPLSLCLLVGLLLKLPPGVNLQFQVRVWQPHIDTSKIKEPVRFWELVEWRPVTTTTAPPITHNETITTTPVTTTTTTTSTTTTSTVTTTTTTTAAPTSVKWEPPTTVKICDASDTKELMRRMKDSGVYNEIYMAPDFFTASQTFPNLGGRKYMSSKSKYTCDEQCKRSSRLVRLVMNGEDTPEMPKESARTWWDQSQWDRSRNTRSIKEHYFNGSRRRELEQTIRSALKELETMDNKTEEISDTEERFEDFFTHELRSHKRRFRRTVNDLEMIAKNSGTTRDVLGTTIALECQDKYSEAKPKSGYHFCSSCRAVRHLPQSYFPRILNEVICGDSSCVRGDGRCAQRFLPFKV